MRISSYRLTPQELEEQFNYQQESRELVEVPDLLIQPVNTDIATLSQLGVQPSELPYTGDLLVNPNISYDELARRNTFISEQLQNYNERLENHKELLKQQLEEQKLKPQENEPS